MPIIISVFLLCLTLVLQVGVAPLFSIKNATPDFLLIAVLAITFQKGRVWGMGAAFFSGIVLDIMGTGIIGLSSLAKSIAAYGAGFLSSERIERRFGMMSGLLITVLFIHDAAYFLILDIGTGMSFWRVILTHVIPSSIYTFCFLIMLHLVKPRILWGTPGMSR
ncbi:rod shape-determining protein MreD [bacterium]|nr:rod shape-determining protein MreD [bacterium]